ncbi:MAG: RNA polymerase sigma factor [Acidobacteria bacterium]|nr:RNA polymerase sigma factor [Acidobacteriota bacterium]
MTPRKQSRPSGPRSRQEKGPSAFPGTFARIAARDKTALLELYARLAPWMLAMTLEITSDRQDAASAVEETFVRLWLEAPRLPNKGFSVIPWLVLTARRVALQRRWDRSGTQKGSSFAPGPLSDSFAWLPTQAEFDRLEQRRELLRRILRQLPKHQHEALMLAVWDGLGEEAIAQRLGEPLARVQSGLRAGMRFIRHRMRVVLGTWSALI